MRNALLLMGAGVVACVGAATQPAFRPSPAPAPAGVAPAMGSPAAPGATAPTLTVANVPMPTLTSEEQRALARVTASHLDAARTHVAAVAQRAVRDRDEGLFREPTAAEAAALALPASSGVPQERPVSVGGYAVRTDAAGISLLVAAAGKDGVVTSHDDKGGRRDR